MRLKTVTTGLLIFGLVLTLGFPFFIGGKPEGSGPEFERAQMEYAIKFGSYWIVVMFVWVAVLICAWIVFRQTIKNLRKEREQMLTAFVAGTLKDHEAHTAAKEENQPSKIDE